MIILLLPPISGATGELSEWLKEHDWKSCNGQKPFGGSNPPLSAKSAPQSGAHLFLAESGGFEVTEMLAGSGPWRQPGGLSEGISRVPAFRAAGGDAAQRWPRRESPQDHPASTLGGAHLFLAESGGFEVTEMLAGSGPWRQPGGCRKGSAACQHFVRPEGTPHSGGPEGNPPRIILPRRSAGRTFFGGEWGIRSHRNAGR